MNDDIQNNNIENQDTNKKQKSHPFRSVLAFIGVFLLLNTAFVFLEMFVFGIHMEHNKFGFMIGSDVSQIQSDTTIVCTGYNPVYAKNGDKSYKVNFKTRGDDNVFFQALVNADEIDEKHLIEVDAEYDGTITYTYIDKAFELKKNNLSEEEINEIILTAIQEEEDFRRFFAVSDIDFLYGNQVIDNNETTAMEQLNQYILEPDDVDTTETTENPIVEMLTK